MELVLTAGSRSIVVQQRGGVSEYDQQPRLCSAFGLPEVNALLVIVEVKLSGGLSPCAMKVEDNPVSKDQYYVEEVRNVQEIVPPLEKQSQQQAGELVCVDNNMLYWQLCQKLLDVGGRVRFYRTQLVADRRH